MRKGARCLTLALLAGCAGSPPSPPGPQPNGGQPPVNLPRPGAAAPAPASATSLHRLANGLTVSLNPHRDGAVSQLQLGIVAGSDFSEPGLAELAATVIVEGSDATSGRQSLRQSIRDLGGAIGVEVNPRTTWLTIRVPQGRWQLAQAALRDALVTPAVSRSQIERIREAYVVERIGQIWSNPATEVPRAFLLGNASTSAYIASLLERDASQVSLFITRLYRPDSTVLALEVPGHRDFIIERLGAGIGTWPAPAAARETVTIEPRRLRPGIFWAPAAGDELCRAMLILPLPDVTNPMAAELLVMHACLTLDGIGGRLEQLQHERGLGHIRWNGTIVRLGDAPALALSAQVTPQDALALWDVAQSARRSLRELAPTPSELTIAIRRADLTARLLSEDAATRGRVGVALTTLQIPADAISKRLAQLTSPKAFKPVPASAAYTRQPAAMVVIGGQIPEGASGVTVFELLPAGALARLGNADPVAQSLAATPWLDRAVEAAGGRERLRRLIGFEASSTTRTAGAPEATERVRWNTTTGELTRSRTILGATIETVITAEAAVETSGAQQLKLDAGSVALLRREMRRHPIGLLAAYARGDLRFRPVAQRTVGDRDLMILESIGDDFDRLRIHIDTVSNLIRVVEVWETTTDGSFVHLHEAWSDYRSRDAVRTPFRRITDIDDGRNRVETAYAAWRPLSSTQ